MDTCGVEPSGRADAVASAVAGAHDGVADARVASVAPPLNAVVAYTGWFTTAFELNEDTQKYVLATTRPKTAKRTRDGATADATADATANAVQVGAPSLLAWLEGELAHADALNFKFAGKNQLSDDDRRVPVQERAVEAVRDATERAKAAHDMRPRKLTILTEGDNFEDGQMGRPLSPFSVAAFEAFKEFLTLGYDVKMIMFKKEQPSYSKAFVEGWKAQLESIDTAATRDVAGRVFFLTTRDEVSTPAMEAKSTVSFAHAHVVYFIGTTFCMEHMYKANEHGTFKVDANGDVIPTTGYFHLMALKSKLIPTRSDVEIIDL
tara:strand:+ start:734 stop:1696 length:963 start_codon:yes stop_codon:yes gene_type:complete